MPKVAKNNTFRDTVRSLRPVVSWVRYEAYRSVVAFFVLASLVSFSSSEMFGVDLYVSPTGNDSWSGTLAAPNEARTDGPLKTLLKARNVVRDRFHGAGRQRDIVVMLRGGQHVVEETIVFGLQDAAAAGHTVTYRNYPGEEPVLTPAVKITGWEKLRQPPPELPEQAIGKVWIADLPEELERFSALYDGETSLPRARSAGFFPTEKSKTRSGPAYLLKFPPGALRNYANLNDVEIVICPSCAWSINILPLESVDEQALVARTAVPATYQLGKIWSSYGTFATGSAFVENVIEALDEPGEWVIDTETRKIYLWPIGDRPSDKIVAPRLTELIRVEGEIDYDGPVDTPVKNLVFHGLTFTQGDRFQWEKDKTGWTLQHDWELFDKPTALLRLRGAQGCVVENCRFTNSAGSAVRLDLYCQDNRIVNNRIDHIDEVGVLLAGYGPGTKDVNKRNEVFNNHVHHLGQRYWRGLGIFAWQSGENRIANNLIHDLPFMAIVASGRIWWDRSGRKPETVFDGESAKTIRWHEVDLVLGKNRDEELAQFTRSSWDTREQFLHSRKNIIERNDIHHVVQKLGDGNAIYISGAGKGNIVRENYVHDNLARHMCEGIRCDDDQHETTIERNIIHRNAGSSVGVATKGTNHIINNIIADLIPGNWILGYISLQSKPATGAIIQRNILYSRHRQQRICFWREPAEESPQLSDCQADYNLYFNSDDPDWGTRHIEQERRNGIETHSISADPLFIDMENGDFRLAPASPALKLGFQPIDMRKIGLTDKFPQRVNF